MNDERSGTRNVLAVGYSAQATLGLVNGFVPLLFLRFEKEFGFGFVTLGLLILLHFAARSVMNLFALKIARRLGYKQSLALGMTAMAFGLLVMGFLPEYTGGMPAVFAGALLSGIGAGCIGAPVGKLIRFFSEGNEERINLIQFWNTVGSVVAILISLVFFSTAGIEKWRILTVIISVIPILIVSASAFIRFITPEDDAEERSGSLFGNAMFWVLFFLMFFSGITEQSMGQWIAYYTEVSLEFANVFARLIGPLLFVTAVGASRLLFGKFFENIRLQRYLIYACGLGAAAYLMAILSRNEILSLIGCVLVGLFVGILRPGTLSLASSKMSAEDATPLATLLFAGDLGYGVGPALVGTFAGIFDNNLKKGMIIALIFPIAMIVIIMKVNKNLTGKLIREKRTWIGLAAAAIVITASALIGGCKGPSVTEPTPTPTQTVVDTPMPLATNTPALADQTPTPTVEPVLVTPTPTPTIIPTKRPTESPTPLVTPTPLVFANVTIYDRSGTVVVNVDSIFIRKGPGTEYGAVGGGTLGEEFTLTGETSNGWYRIKFKGTEAFMSGTYSSIKAGSPTNTPTPKPVATNTPKPVATNTPRATSTPTPIPTQAATVSFDDYAGFNGAAYIAIDAKTGQTLHKYNDTIAWSPASLSKLLTALIAVEQFELNDTCEASLETLRWNDVVYKNNVVPGLDSGMVTYASYIRERTGKEYTAEQWMNASFSVKDRLYQMLLASCADAAEAIAYKIEENLDFFAEQIMKDKIDELGLTGTKLNNAVGADGSCNTAFNGNVSTARDLAIIAKAVMDDPILRDIVSTQTYTMRQVGDISATVIENSNSLLTDSAFRSDNFTCIGIKTGYTGEAGYCLAACGRDVDGNEVIVVTLGNEYKKENYTQTMKMLDYIFKYEK